MPRRWLAAKFSYLLLVCTASHGKPFVPGMVSIPEVIYAPSFHTLHFLQATAIRVLGSRELKFQNALAKRMQELRESERGSARWGTARPSQPFSTAAIDSYR